jgi:hypothetical protein
MPETLTTAKNCRHYAMCKIDFLGSGVCASGTEKHYVSFYPQGGLAQTRPSRNCIRQILGRGDA